MYSIFTMQAIVTAAVFHAAVAQVPFQLVCPDAGFKENVDNTVECTVRGSDVKGTSCAAPVSLIRLETVDAGVPNSIAHSPFPTCDNNWFSVNNDNGRCTNIVTNTDVYTYQFNVTADRAILTNLTVLRCFAECSGGPGVGNPFKFNASKTCGPPVIFAEQTTTVPPSTSETPILAIHTGDNCNPACAGGSSGGSITMIGGVAVIVGLYTTMIKVLMCHHGEQMTRLDFYAKRFKQRKRDLEKELRKIMNFCIVRFKASIEDSDHRFALVQLPKIANHNKLKDLAIAVNNFVKKNVKPVHVRTVPVLQNATIPDMAPIEQKTNIKIFPPGPVSTNEAETAEKKAVDEKKYCIQIEGTSEKDVEDAEKEVKEQLWNGTFDITIPNAREIEEEAKQYIEQMTGTTIVHDKKNHSYQIKGSNGNFTEKASAMVVDFMAKNVRMVPVLFWNISSKEHPNKQIQKIATKTRTKISCCPFYNGTGQYVIKIEEPDKNGNSGKAEQKNGGRPLPVPGRKENTKEAEKQVKDFLSRQTSDLSFDVPKQIQEAALEYIQYATGTIMVPLADNANCSIRVEGINQKYTEKARDMVLEFLKENGRIVVIPPWNQPIPHEILVSIARKTNTNIYTPMRERCVIKIEGQGSDEKKSVKAENKVMALLKRQVVTSRTITLPEDIRDDVREYIEEMTGTTITPLPDSKPRRIEIEGTSEEYLTKAEKMVEEYLEKNARVVTVTIQGSSMSWWKEKLHTIEKETNTTIDDPVEMGKQEYVILIVELKNNQGNSSSCKAEKRVKALIAPPSDSPPLASPRSEIV